MTTVLVAGASGFIGTALSRELRRRGWVVRRLVRRAPTDMDDIRWGPTNPLSPAHLSGVDAVVNLAGVGIGDRRWSGEYRRLIVSSRVRGTEALAHAIAGADHPVRFVQASAVGFYGDRGEEELDESSSIGKGFLAEVVVAWEGAAQPAVEAGAPVAFARTGIVLAPEGGAAAPLLRLGRLGLLGPIGSGKQWWPWITLTDEVSAIIHLIKHPEVRGPVNLVAPAPDRQRDVARALAAGLHRPGFLPAPAWAVRLAMGGFAADILASQRVTGSALVASGFGHTHRDLAAAAAYVTDPAD